jgi:hypothetical protein
MPQNRAINRAAARLAPLLSLQLNARIFTHMFPCTAHFMWLLKPFSLLLRRQRAIVTRLGVAVLLLAITRQPIVGVGLYGFTLIRVMIFINFVSYKNVIAIKILKLLCSCPNKGPTSILPVCLPPVLLFPWLFIVILIVFIIPSVFHCLACSMLIHIFSAAVMYYT